MSIEYLLSIEYKSYVKKVEDALLASVREWFNFVVDKIPTQVKYKLRRVKQNRAVSKDRSN